MKLRMRAITALLAMMLSPLSVAEQLNGKYEACATEDLLDQLVRAATKDDTRAWNYLMTTGCFRPKAGVPITVLDTTWSGKVKIRAYAGDRSLELWTVREALQR